jgi:RimJ/RimL family protein N-acetyltransferase
MHSQAVRGLEVARVEGDRDLEAMIAVRAAADPDRPPPPIENLRHNLAAQKGLVYVVARIGETPVACGFTYPDVPGYAEAHLVVVPASRRRGIGTAVLAELGAAAFAANRAELEGEVRADDEESRAFFERRDYRIVGGEKAVALDLTELEPSPPTPPPGVTIVSRAERPELTDALYELGAEGAEDIPGFSGRPTYEQWRATDIDRPSRDPRLFFVALAGEEPVGYAALENFRGPDAHHGLTTVKRSWRRRGIATVLKQAQIAAAKQAGFRRLITENEERNAPMRRLNEKLGYKPEPALSTIVLRGPADVRSRHGDD